MKAVLEKWIGENIEDRFERKNRGTTQKAFAVVLREVNRAWTSSLLVHSVKMEAWFLWLWMSIVRLRRGFMKEELIGLRGHGCKYKEKNVGAY